MALSPLGIPPQVGSTGLNESVSSINGSVNLYIPLLSLPQRGGYTLNLAFIHHSNNLNPSQQTSDSSTLYNEGGQNIAIDHIDYAESLTALDNPLEINLPRLQISSEFLGHYQSDNVLNAVFCETNFAFTDWQGNRHGFSNLTNCNVRYGVSAISSAPIDVSDALDGSFYRLDTSNHADMKVFAKDGTVYHFYGDSDLCPVRASQNCAAPYSSAEAQYDNRAGLIADPNGNTITIQYTGQRSGLRDYSITDTLGRTLTIDESGIGYSDSNGIQQRIQVAKRLWNQRYGLPGNA